VGGHLKHRRGPKWLSHGTRIIDKNMKTTVTQAVVQTTLLKYKNQSIEDYFVKENEMLTLHITFNRASLRHEKKNFNIC